MFETLDIGCGANPKGDVNIDLFPNRRDQCVIPWNPREIKNFVWADAENLPFQDKAFKRIYAFHVCEHLRNPFQAFKEWARVAKVVIIRVPSPYDLDRTKTHFYTWNQSTLRNLLSLVFKHVKVSYTSRGIRLSGRLSKYIPLLRLVANRFPREIKAICWD